MGYVYLLLEVDKDGDERHKIGFSRRHPEKRKRECQTGNSNVISVLNFYETPNYLKVEKWLHGNYANQKTEANNEWFKLTNEQVGGFLEACGKADETIKFMIENNPFYR